MCVGGSGRVLPGEGGRGRVLPDEEAGGGGDCCQISRGEGEVSTQGRVLPIEGRERRERREVGR